MIKYLSSVLLYFVLLVISFSGIINAQSFKVMLGKHNPKSKVVTDFIGSTIIGGQYEIDLLELSYPLSDKLSLNVTYCYFFAKTKFSYDLDFVADGSSVGVGSGRTQLRRFGLGGTYYLFNYHNRIKIGPHFRLEYEETYKEILGYHATVNDDPGDDPKFKPWTVYVEAFESSQIVPTLGVRADIYLFWRVSFHGEIFRSWGHRPYQRLYYEHHLNGVKQPTAEWYSDGTMLAAMWGLSVQLWGKKRKLTKERNWF